MKVGLTGSIGAALLAFVACATPAMAQNQSLFSGSDERVDRVTLTFDGITSFSAVDTGYISSGGAHGAFNQSYFVGQSGNLSYNNYFSFLLGAAAPVSPYTSAVLRIQNGNSAGPLPIIYNLYDVGASIAELDTQRSAGNAGGQALFTDLGSGVLYGSNTYTQPTMLTGFDANYTTIALNQAFLDKVNGGLLNGFAIGGAIAASSGAVPAVPEPATWAMMLVGFGMIGATARYRRRRTATTFA